jgi:hypothetical protein
MLDAVDDFYGDVVQHLKAWSATSFRRWPGLDSAFADCIGWLGTTETLQTVRDSDDHGEMASL